MALLHLQHRQCEPANRSCHQIATDRQREVDPTIGRNKQGSADGGPQGKDRCYHHHPAGQQQATPADIPLATQAQQRNAQPVGDGNIGHLANSHHKREQAVFGLIDQPRGNDQQQQRRQARQQDRGRVDKR
jgi:hypothetical protein